MKTRLRASSRIVSTMMAVFVFAALAQKVESQSGADTKRIFRNRSWQLKDTKTDSTVSVG